MPTYEYACTECGEQLEVVQSFTDDALTVCPACKGKLRKVFSPVGVVFKGSGFYKTDSRAGRSNGAKQAAGDTLKSSESGSDKSAASNGSDSGSGSGSDAGSKSSSDSTSSSSSDSGSASNGSRSSKSKGSDSKGTESKGGGSKVA
jgi:putative FmdB family regulatory protein